MNNQYTIATLGSHSALQILKGAKDEGFKTLAVCLPEREKIYQNFNVADKIITIKNYSQFMDLDEKLADENVILIPHASLIAYLGCTKVENLKMKYYGNKKILLWESDRVKEREWLKKSDLKVPKTFKRHTDIDRSVIVKFDGAGGGKGYFLTNSPKDFHKKIKNKEDRRYFIQEYIIGIPIYAHYFYSPLEEKLEIMGFDKRYESNADSLGRISASDQIALGSIDPSYVICGNIPIVIRESFLPKILEMGQSVVKTAKEISPPGLFGPFCLEMIISPQKEFYVFEISARIVAGTNPYINGSPYTNLCYDQPMSTGRRIAREIKIALQDNRLNEIIT